MRLLIITIFLSSLGLPLECHAEVDPYVLSNSTADTIETAKSKLHTGEMELEYNHKATNIDPQTQLILVNQCQVTARVIWRDDYLYSEYTLQDESTDRDGDKDAKAISVGWAGPGEVIKTPAFFARTVKNHLWCEYKTKDLQSAANPRYYDAMRPDKTWFSVSPGDHKNCQHVTLLTLHESDNRVQTTTVTPVKSHPRRLQIVRDYTGKDFQTGFVVDLDQGGLVVESWNHHPKQNWSGSTWDWKQDAHGVWYASKWTHTVFNRDDLDSVKSHAECVVKSFNSQPTIPANRFEFSSLKLTQGTRIEKTTEKGKTITYVGGKPPARNKQKFDLDSLIDESQSGFAAPPEK